MPAIEYLIAALLVFILLEVGLNLLIKWLRQDFQWLITEADEVPHLDRPALEKFFINSYDPELGWVRRPNTTGVENSRVGESTYTIDADGARLVAGYTNEEAEFSCYGDSFTFCRQVNDDETWPYNLAAHSNTRVLNFGVGNYGLDQALLRLKREFSKHPTPVVIMAVVPETISRVLSVWKHYSEYGNTFAFKPRFKLGDNGLKVVPTLVDVPEKFFDLEPLLSTAREEDHFYYLKFRRDMLKFPYCASLLRTAHRNVPLLASLCLARLFAALNIRHDFRAALFKRFVLDRNTALCAKLYNEPKHEDLLFAILQEFADFCRTHNAQPIFMMLPQLTDIEYLTRTSDHYYGRFMARAKAIMPSLDLSQQLIDHGEQTQLYSDDHYGGHFNSNGNKLVSLALIDLLKSLGLTKSQTQQIRG